MTNDQEIPQWGQVTRAPSGKRELCVGLQRACGGWVTATRGGGVAAGVGSEWLCPLEHAAGGLCPRHPVQQPVRGGLPLQLPGPRPARADPRPRAVVRCVPFRLACPRAAGLNSGTGTGSSLCWPHVGGPAFPQPGLCFLSLKWGQVGLDTLIIRVL